mgnify:FL=1
MKPLIVKIFIILPLILFADYIILALLGCSACLFGSGDDFYCGPFCIIGKILLLISFLFFVFLIYPDIKNLYRHKKNAQAQKEA